jgi:hypothetical protein
MAAFRTRASAALAATALVVTAGLAACNSGATPSPSGMMEESPEASGMMEPSPSPSP